MTTSKLDINSYFLEYLLENKFTFLVCVLLLFTYPLQRVVLPKYYGKVISNLQDGPNKKFLESSKTLLIIYASVQLLHSLYQKVQGALVPRFSEFSLKKVFVSLLDTDSSDYEELKIGEILAKLTKLPGIIYRYLDILKSVVFSQIIVFATCVFHYYQVSASILTAFLFVVCGVIVLQLITYKSTMTLETVREKEQDKIYQHFQDVLNNLVSVMVCKSEENEKERLGKLFTPFTSIFNKVLNMNFIMRVILSLFNIFSFVLLNYILYRGYLEKTITKEVFISSFIVTYSVLQLFNDAGHSVRLLVDMTSQITDMERFFNEDVFSARAAVSVPTDDDISMNFANGDIVLKNVSYKYKNGVGSQKALDNVNIKIKQNENVAIVGHIGSGKSTLVKVLLKLIRLDPSQGNIEIGGVNLRSISKSELYDNVFYIPQKPKLLNRTVYENIVYGIETDGKSKMLKKINGIMEALKLDKHTKSTINGMMDENIGNEGSRLSGGQRQVIWFIRALLRDTSIIIMDEPTASLDKKNKQKILDIIDKIGVNKTVIIVTHDDIGYNFRKIYLSGGKVVTTLI